MSTEITFIVEYRCPRCEAALEARSTESHGWLRCPNCGRASLPPEHMRTPRPKARLSPDEDVLVIGPERPGESRSGPGRSAHRHVNFRRVAAATGLFLSLLIALVSMLDQDRLSATIFLGIALACLAVSIYPARARLA